jgi:hypothetical protein
MLMLMLMLDVDVDVVVVDDDIFCLLTLSLSRFFFFIKSMSASSKSAQTAPPVRTATTSDFRRADAALCSFAGRSPAALVLLYALRVYWLNGFYIVSYGLAIYVLNLLLGFLVAARRSRVRLARHRRGRGRRRRRAARHAQRTFLKQW